MSTIIHCSAPCIHVENGCCKKKDIILKFDYHDDYVYCCHFEEVKE